jgi:hypothetical protein
MKRENADCLGWSEVGMAREELPQARRDRHPTGQVGILDEGREPTMILH